MNRKRQMRLLTALYIFDRFSCPSIHPAPATEEISISCEILEVSGSAETEVEQLKTIGFMIIHHPNVPDRQVLSQNSRNKEAMGSTGASLFQMIGIM
jgi:hypothetical protein